LRADTPKGLLVLLFPLMLAACAGATATAPADPKSTRSAESSSASPGVDVVVAPFAMKAPTPSELGDKLTAIGLDPKELPPLTKLHPDQIRKVMPLIAKSLGVKCTACHIWNSDGPPPRTPRMNVAEQMWNRFVRGLTLADGQPLFCDSCHHGSMQVVDRHDTKALGAWMKESFVIGLSRNDQKENECATCHGNPMQPRFINLWRTSGKGG